MRRATEVIDAWFDSGSMPFAQWGFPHARGVARSVRPGLPGGLHQRGDRPDPRLVLLAAHDLDARSSTRRRSEGLGLSRVRGYPHPYKTCMVLGHVCDREGKKESKSKGNYTPPEVILERVRMEFAVDPARRRRSGGRVKRRSRRSPASRSSRARTTRGSTSPATSAKVVLYRGDRGAESGRDGAPSGEEAPAPRRRARPRTISRGSGSRRRERPLAIKPNDVPGLPAAQRVYVEDPATPAPGADAFRWFFYASSPPWTNTRHSLTNVRSAQKEFLVKLRNVYSFFVIYANIDGFSPAAGNPDATAHDARCPREEHGLPPREGAEPARPLDPLRARARDARGDRAASRRTGSTRPRSGSSISSTRSRTGTCGGAARASGRLERARQRRLARQARRLLHALRGARHDLAS